MDFNIEDLFKFQKVKDDHKKQVFYKVLEQCIKRVKFVNKNSNSTCLVYTIPSLIPGQPVYNITECLEFLLKELTTKGFKAEMKDPCSIFISWETRVSDEEPSVNILSGLTFNKGKKRKR
jgi:hypothetical protein